MVEPTEFAPRKKLLAHFEEGWRLIPGHEYQSSDWAILVYMPTYPKPVELAEMIAWTKRFERHSGPVLSNHSAASRQALRKRARRLTDEQVAEIRKRLATGEKHWRVALRFGVGRSTITDISAGRTWSDVGGLAALARAA